MRDHRGRRHFWAHVGVLACVCLAAACASHRPRSLSDRFVRQATPEDLDDGVDLGFPAVTGPASAAGSAELAATPREKHSDLPTIEQQDEALAGALDALDTTPAAPQHVQVGREYQRLGIFDSAYASFHAALQLNPRDAGAYEALARLWRDNGFPAIALGDAHRAVSFAPSSASARNTFATVLYALGDWAGAEREFLEVLELEPGAAWARSNLCYIAFLQGRASHAVELCEAALAAAPDLTVARNNLALVHAAAGRLDAAKDAFIAAGGLARGLYNTGIVHLARGDYAAAVDAFDAAFREDPAMRDAARRAAEARARVVDVRK